MTTRRGVAGAAAALAFLGLGACATVPSPEIISVTGGPGALRCGTLALEGLGYETRRAGPGVVEADQVVPGRPAPADRHVVELALADGERPRLVATVTRWRYQPSGHALPIRHRAVNQARPDGDEVAAVRRAVEACGTEVRRGPTG